MCVGERFLTGTQTSQFMEAMTARLAGYSGMWTGAGPCLASLAEPRAMMASYSIANEGVVGDVRSCCLVCCIVAFPYFFRPIISR